MKRIIYDVPRWSCFLHRDARGLPSVDHAEPALRRFEDELFEKLYAGEVEPLADVDRDPGLAKWAAETHAACDTLPDFTRLSFECRGDAMASAVAVEKLVEDLRPRADAPALRRTLRQGCAKASAVVDELRETMDGLDHVAFGPGHGTGTTQGETRPSSEARALAQRIRESPRLRQIALLAGRFKRIAAAKRRSKVRHGADEIADIGQGADLGRLLPSELARLVHPTRRLAMLRDLMERRCLQYELAGTEALGKGPLVVCLDKSGSMEGGPDIWATAVALALLEVAQRERRPFAMLSFDESIKHEVVVAVGDALPEKALFVCCGGGTNIACVVSRGLDVIERHPGALRKADIVLITDGGSATEEAAALRSRAAILGVSVLGIGIGVSGATLEPWCDDIHVVAQLDRIDERAAESLFAAG